MRHMHVRATTVAIVLIFLLVGTGCTSVNEPLGTKVNRTRAALAAAPPPMDAQADQRIGPATLPVSRPANTAGNYPRDDGFFVGVAISGGGSRSANFSAACMFQLQRLGLLQRADYVSAVSGGALSAAYYCVSDDTQWNVTNVTGKLSHGFANDALFQMLLPWNPPLLTFTDWDRSDLLAGSFRNVLFTRKGKALTFSDLREDRPRLLINSTDLQSGKPFVFCNETFDHLKSDLANYPLAHAVAASSAVPVLLHQVTLRDYAAQPDKKQYRHLIDGGVVDNLGVKSLVETYRAQLRDGGGEIYPRGAVFIVIDARTEYDARLSDRGDTSLLESLQFGAGVTSTVLINRASSATLAEIILDSAPDHVDAATLRRERQDLIERGYVRIEDVGGRPVYVLHLALSRVNELDHLPFKTFSQNVNSISTYFNIKKSEVKNLYLAAELLVGKRYHRELAAIAQELNRRH